MFKSILNLGQPHIKRILTKKINCLTYCVNSKNRALDETPLHIDVRFPVDIKKCTEMPNSINIPWKHLATVLGPCTSEAQFERQYRCHKPDECTHLIFTCGTGKHARIAACQAMAMGFRTVSYYNGPCTDLLEN